MAARQSNNSGNTSTALVTAFHAMQLCVDPLDPAFLANTEMRRLILGCGTPTDKQLQALCWYSWDRVMRGAGLATSRLLRYPGLFPEEPPFKIVWEEEQRDVIEAAWREEHWFALPPQGTKFGKVERVALLRAAAIPWRIFNGGRRRERGSGASGFFGVFERASGRWQVQLKIAGEQVYVGTCDKKEDAARLVDITLVIVGEEAPENFPGPFQEWLDAGGHGDVPAELVAAALQRVGSVGVSGMVPVESTEAPAAASSLKKEIDEAITADPVKQSRAVMKLSDVRLHASEHGGWVTGSIKGANWNTAQGRHMESKGVKTVYKLAVVDVNNVELALAMTLCDDTKVGRKTARNKLWRWKCAAAALLGVKELDRNKPPPTSGTGRAAPKERTPKQQHALDVALRWASRAGTADDEVATEYATALAAVARRQLSKNSSGGDGVAKPPRKKHHC